MISRKERNQPITAVHFQCDEYTTLGTCTQRALETAKQKERQGWRLISCTIDSYEPYRAGKRGQTYNNNIGDNDSILGLLGNMSANIIHNLKEVTNVTLFFRKLSRNDPRPPTLKMELLTIGRFQFSRTLVDNVTRFMQGKDIVSVTIDSYMPTSITGSTSEKSLAVVFYR